MARDQADDEGGRRDGPVARAVDWIFGYDFFLSYSHRDGLRFPRRLKEHLEHAGFRVFLDQTEYVAGVDLRRETKRQVAKSRKIVVVGRAGALKSDWVRREVEVALAHGKVPVIIDINGAVDAASRDAAVAAIARERHWLRLIETLEDPDGEPSDRTVAELARGFAHTRQETKRQRVFGMAAAILAVTASAAIWQAIEATKARKVAENQRDRAQRVLDQVVATGNRRVHALLARQQTSTSAGPTREHEGQDAPSLQLDRANSLTARANALLDQEDVRGARVALETALNILGLAPEASQRAAEWQFARLRAYDRFAVLAMKVGENDTAISTLKKSLELVTTASKGSNGREWQDAAAVIHTQLGNFHFEIKQLAEAEIHYRAAHEIRLGISAEDPESSSAKRHLAIATTLIGSLLAAQPNMEGALQAYKKGLLILETLALRNADNSELQSDIAIVCQRIADALEAGGKFEAALEWLDKDYAVSAIQASHHPDQLLWQRGLASNADRRGRVLEKLGRTSEALEQYGKGSAILEEIVAKGASKPSWQRDLAAILETQGKALARTGQVDLAIVVFRRALAIRERLAASFEEHTWQREVEAAYRRTSELMLAIGREEEALETAEQYLLSTTLATDEDGKPERVGRALGTLCWSALNAKNFARSLWAGREAVALAPGLAWVKLNYAHALMLTGDRDGARIIYLSGLAQPPKEAQEWKKSIRKDFEEMKSRRLEEGLMAEIMAQLDT